MHRVVAERQRTDVPMRHSYSHYAFCTSVSYKNGKVASSYINDALNAILIVFLTYTLPFYTRMFLLHVAIMKHVCPDKTVSLCALLRVTRLYSALIFEVILIISFVENIQSS
jgi:hypothetical protein